MQEYHKNIDHQRSLHRQHACFFSEAQQPPPALALPPEHISFTQLASFSSLFPPVILPTSAPSLRQRNVGIMATLYLLESASHSSPSISSVTKVPLPSAAHLSYAGCIALHGLHQSAVNSTKSSEAEEFPSANTSSHLPRLSMCSTAPVPSGGPDDEAHGVGGEAAGQHPVPHTVFFLSSTVTTFFFPDIPRRRATNSGSSPKRAN
mmetsp:Transcript_12890/g.29415  ORF Transcript_12890/g.29415 Transcript_12890/m.29415 type:complete len:206 (+) Transcript_12890:145-762(+)